MPPTPGPLPDHRFERPDWRPLLHRHRRMCSLPLFHRQRKTKIWYLTLRLYGQTASAIVAAIHRRGDTGAAHDSSHHSSVRPRRPQNTFSTHPGRHRSIWRQTIDHHPLLGRRLLPPVDHSAINVSFHPT